MGVCLSAELQAVLLLGWVLTRLSLSLSVITSFISNQGGFEVAGDWARPRLPLFHLLLLRLHHSSPPSVSSSSFP